VAALVLALFRCLLTAIWAFVNARQRQVLLDLHERAREVFPEYRRTIGERKLPGGRISGTSLMAFWRSGFGCYYVARLHNHCILKDDMHKNSFSV
jgi:hypothetical protein